MSRLPGLFAVVALAALANAAPASAALLAGESQVAAPIVRADVHDLGRAGARTTVTIALTLAYQHASELDGLIDAQSDPSSPVYGRFLTTGQFNAYFAPSPAAYVRAQALLARAGFTIAHTYANRTLLDARAPANVAERYFQTEIHNVRQDGYGLRYANLKPATMPSELAGMVTTVVGLDNVQKARFLYQFAPHPAKLHPLTPAQFVRPGVIGGPLNGPDGGYGPLAIAQGFDFPVQHGIDGTGHTLANVAGDVQDTDLSAFTTYFGITRTGTTLRTTIQNGSSGANVEATLDAETMGSLDPGANLHLYILADPIDQPGEDAYNQIVTDNSVDAVNSSFGVCEGQDRAYGKAAAQIIGQGEALGISWSASTGDGGAFECGGSQLVPASIRRVTGVGGTHLTVDSNGNYVSESAWTDGGGGIASNHGLPFYQKNVQGLGSGTKRNLPDIAFPADVQDSWYYLGSWAGPIGGTSWASPQFIALQTEINQMKKARAGFVDPKIYRVFIQTGYKAFNDITTGNNGYPAVTGYDLATGIGSIKGFTFAKLEK